MAKKDTYTALMEEEKPGLEEKKLLKYGYRAWKWVFLVAAVWQILVILTNEGDHLWDTVFLLIFFLLFLLFRRARRLKYDSKNLYINRLKKDKAIPYEHIISIKRSAAKVNGGRYWILQYADETGKKRKIRFDASFTKEFRDSVKKVNPSVVIWTHPHFNH